MARSYLTSVNLNGNTLFNAALHPQGSAPSVNAQGQVWYDTANKIVKVYDGTWNAVGNAVAAGGGPTSTPSSAGSFYFDTTNLDLYVANGNSSSANWKPAVSGSLIPLNKLATPTANYDISSSGYTIRATTPVNALDVVNKSYADTIATGLNAHEAVSYASTANVSGTYTAVSAGVGDYLSGTGALTIDGYTFTTTDVSNATRVLLKDQTFSDQNGIYTVTAIVAATSWKLTRAIDYDTFPEVSAGDFAFVISGTANGKFTYVQISKPTQISGTGAAAGTITFSVFANGNLSGTVTVSQGGTGLTTTPTNGQLLIGNGTNYTLGTIATVANQTSITNGSGTITIGTVQNIGTGSTPTFSALTLTNALTAGNGGTGLSSYTAGDLLYASGTSTLASLADVATGNVLLSGGAGVAPAYGKVGLTTHVTGILPIANGGTGSNITTATSGQFLVGNGTVFAPRALAFTDLVATTATATSNTTSAVITAQYSVTQKLSVTFTGTSLQSSFVITHSLGRFVVVQVTDTNGLQVECDVTNTATTTTVTFASSPANGVVYYCTIIG